MSLIYASYYYGTPPDQIPALEAVAQATVSSLFDLAQAIGQMEETERSFGDADYTITRGSDGLLLYTDHSAGWWAILQATRPFPHLPHRVEFKVFARLSQATVPAKVRKAFTQGKADWKWLGDEFLYGRADLYIAASRDNADAWYGPLNLINYTHPLLFNLRHAVDEIHGKES